MKYTLIRDIIREGCTMGQLFRDGENEPMCSTLEPPVSDFIDEQGARSTSNHPAIAEGEWQVKIDFSPHFQRDMPHVLVKGRVGILIHPGNSMTDTLGCILVGLHRDEATGRITDSIAAWEPLVQEIWAASARGEDVFLEVIRA